MAETLEDKVNANLPQQKEEEEKKPVSVLGSALEEIVDGVGTAANLAVAGGLPWIADRGIGNFKGMGGFGATSTAAAFYLGADDKSSKSARNEGIVATLFAAFANYTLGAISQVNAYARAALIPLWQMAANAYYMVTDNLVKKKSLYVDKFREKYKKFNKMAILLLSIPTYLTTFLPALWQVPSIAAQSYIFKKYIAREKQEAEKPKDKTPYYVAASNVVKKGITNTFKGIYETLDALVATAKDYMKAPAKITPEPKPA